MGLISPVEFHHSQNQLRMEQSAAGPILKNLGFLGF